MTDMSYQDILKDFRQEIDVIDDEIVDLLARRFAIIKRVAEVKKKHDIPAVLPDRVEQVKRRNALRGSKQGLSADFMTDLYGLIIDHACFIEHEHLAR